MDTMLLELESEVKKAQEAFKELEERVGEGSGKAPTEGTDTETNDEELLKLRTTKAKLEYRIEILKRSIREEEAMVDLLAEEEYLESTLHAVESYLEKAIRKTYPTLEKVPVSVTVANRQKAYDYQCNSALQLVKLVKKEGAVPPKPFEIAQKLMENMPPNRWVKEVKASGPGFIEVSIDPEYVAKKVKSILTYGVRVKPIGPLGRVIVDLSSPNIAKEMHVGHLRSTIIGDCLANLFEFLGYPVMRLNHVGDWGTQFGMLLAHLVEKYPDYMSRPPPISDLQEFYKEAKRRFDEEEDFKKRAYAAVVRLQSKQPDMYAAWQSICQISRNEFAEIYKRLNVHNLIERGESFYQDLMQEVVSDLEAKGLLQEDEGRKIMFTKKPNARLIPLTVVKSDGGFTYDTSDMACIKQRVQVEKAKRIIYVTDGGQLTHFQAIFECAADAGFYDPKDVRVDHVGFGVVLGEDKKKFKTRSGEAVRLKDLLDEGLERSLAKLMEKGREKLLNEEELKAAQEAVAFGCIKYADLSKDRNHEYEFSFDRMLDDRGNTAVYLLYSLTRIRSIVRNANLTSSAADLAKEMTAVKLEHVKEINLGKYLIRFAEIVLQMAEDLYPHSLCAYLYEISVVFSEFYDQCYCIEKKVVNGETTTKVNIDRILLCEATAAVMEKGLNLLGLKTVSKM